MNYTPEEMAHHAKKSKQHWHKGKWRTFTAICKMEKMHRSTLYDVMHKNQTKTASECVDIYHESHKRPGKRLSPVARLAKKIGISYASCNARVKKYGYRETIRMGNKKLQRGGARGVVPRKAKPIDEINIPSFDADLEYKNLINSLLAQGMNDAQIAEQIQKRARF